MIAFESIGAHIVYKSESNKLMSAAFLKHPVSQKKICRVRCQVKTCIG